MVARNQQALGSGTSGSQGESSVSKGDAQGEPSKPKQGSQGRSIKSKGNSQGGSSKSRVTELIQSDQQISDSQGGSTEQKLLMNIIGGELKHAVFEKPDLLADLSSLSPSVPTNVFEICLNRLIEVGCIKFPSPSSQPSSQSQSQSSSTTVSPNSSRTATPLPVLPTKPAGSGKGTSKGVLEVARLEENRNARVETLRKVEKETTQKKKNAVEIGGKKETDGGDDLERAEGGAKTESLGHMDQEVFSVEDVGGTRGEAKPQAPGREAGPWKWKYGMGEQDYYPIFEDLLNHITSELVDGLEPDSVERKIVITYGDKTMVEKIGGAHRLKPDLLVFPPGLDPHRGDRLRSKKNFSWREIEVPIEAKSPSDAKEMFRQAATYARATFAANFNRLFVIVILLGTSNTTKAKGGTVEFVCYCRSGACVASPRICFLTHDGMVDLIRNWAYLLSIKESAWKDSSVSEAGVSINGGTFSYKWDGNIIYQLISLRGRATWVRKARLPPTSDSSVDSVVSEKKKGKNPAKRPRSSGRAPELGDLQRFDKAHVDGCIAPPPTYLVVKDSWPLKSTVNEWEVWSSVAGFFGCPKLWGREVLGDTQKFLPSDAFERGVTNDQTRVSPELREHVRTYLESFGDSVARGREKFSIVQVFEALGHCFLGIVALFEKGFLHRDISPGNIIILESPEERQHLPKCTQETTSSQLRSVGMKCKAVLIDTDHAAKLDGSNQVNEGSATGTFNFMSCRLTNAFAQRSDTSVVHTLLDDLESLLWVLTYFIWLKLPSRHEDSIFEALWRFRGTEPMVGFKYHFAQATSKGMHPRKHIPSDCKRLVSDGLRPLFKVAENASDELSTLIEVEEKWTSSEILLLCRRIVEEYEKVWFDPEVKAAFASVPV